MAKAKNTKGTRQHNRSSNPKPSKPRKKAAPATEDASREQQDAKAATVSKVSKAQADSGTAKGYKDFRDRRGSKAIIVIVAVILAAGMTIPSVAVLLSRSSDTQTSETATEARSTVPDSSWSVDDTNAYYQSLVSQTQDRLDGDPDNVTLLRSMGNNYSSWATTLQNSHMNDEDAQQQARERFADAATYYQRFLDQQDSDPVALNLAEATYGSGDVDGAIAQLQALTEKNPGYAQAWSDLSAIYQREGNQTAATEAAARASEASSAASTAGVATSGSDAAQ